MTKFQMLKPIKIGGKEVNAYLIVGAVVLIVLIGVALQLGWAPRGPVASGLRSLDLEIFKKIGVALKVESKEEAAASIGSIAQELEKARGSVRSINKNLEGGAQEQNQAPVGGLAGFSKQTNEVFSALITIGLLAVAIMFFIEHRKSKVRFVE